MGHSEVASASLSRCPGTTRCATTSSSSSASHSTTDLRTTLASGSDADSSCGSGTPGRRRTPRLTSSEAPSGATSQSRAARVPPAPVRTLARSLGWPTIVRPSAGLSHSTITQRASSVLWSSAWPHGREPAQLFQTATPMSGAVGSSAQASRSSAEPSVEWEPARGERWLSGRGVVREEGCSGRGVAREKGCSGRDGQAGRSRNSPFTMARSGAGGVDERTNTTAERSGAASRSPRSQRSHQRTISGSSSMPGPGSAWSGDECDQGPAITR